MNILSSLLQSEADLGVPIEGNRLPALYLYLSRVVKPDDVLPAVPGTNASLSLIKHCYESVLDEMRQQKSRKAPSLVQDLRVLINGDTASINDPNHLPFNVTVTVDLKKLKGVTPSGVYRVKCSGAPQMPTACVPSQMYATITHGGNVLVKDLANPEIYFSFRWK